MHRFSENPLYCVRHDILTLHVWVRGIPVWRETLAFVAPRLRIPLLVEDHILSGELCSPSWLAGSTPGNLPPPSFILFILTEHSSSGALRFPP